MLVLIGLFLLVDIVVLVSWATTSPFQYLVSNPNNQTETYGIIIEEIVKCDGKYQSQFTIGLFAYKGVVLVFGVFLTWQTANQVNKRSTRNRSEAMAIYNTALVSIVGVVCISLLEDTSHRHALYVILTICVIICCASVVAVLFIPKVNLFYSIFNIKVSFINKMVFALKRALWIQIFKLTRGTRVISQQC